MQALRAEYERFSCFRHPFDIEARPPNARKAQNLEIGETGLFKKAYPDETTWIWTGDKSAPKSADATATPAAMFRVLRQISDKSYDLIVATPPLYSPAHPRYWARAFFRRPWTPWAALTKRFGTSYLRFADASAPLVILDFNDCPSIGAPATAL